MTEKAFSLWESMFYYHLEMCVTTPHGYKPGASGMTRLCRPTA
jgi:hypothetical protein